MVSYAIKRSGEIKAKIERYDQMQKKLEAFISQARQTEEEQIRMNQEIIIKEIPEMLIASIRFKGKYQDVSGALYYSSYYE